MKRFFFLIFILIAFIGIEAQQVSYSSSNDTLFVRYRVGSVQKTIKLVVGMSNRLEVVEQKIDSIFGLIGSIETGEVSVDSVSVTYTISDPPKLQINVTWLDGRVDSLITTRIGQYTLDDLEDVLATTPDDNSILIYRQNTGFWETTPYVTGGSVSNADSLGGQPASAYVRKSDSTIIFATPSQLNSGLALKLNYDFSGYNDGTITNTDLLIYQDVNSGTPRRITFSNFRSGLNIPSISGLATTIYVNQSVDSVRNQIDSVNITYPDVNTIQFSTSGQALQLDPATLEIDQGILTVIGGGDTFDSTFVYQRLAEKLNITDTTAFRTFSDLKYLLSSALNTYWDSVAVKSYLAEILQGDSIIGDKATLDSLILAFWNDELGGGGGVPQDSLNTKLYSSFNTEYPQSTTPSVDNYIPLLTGTGNHYAALGDLPISSAVSSALSGKQNALGFTPENVSNKATNLTSPDNTKYPTTQAVVNALSALDSDLRDYVDGLIGGGGDTIWAISKVEMFSADQDSMIIQSDSGSVLILIISALIGGGYDGETIVLLYDGIPLITGSFSPGELTQSDNLTLSAYVNVNTDDGVGFGLKIEEGLWLVRQNATVITLKQIAIGGGQGMTAEQADALNRLWALAQPDTVATLTAFTPVTDATVSTLYTSNVIGVNSTNPDYSVIKTWTDIGEYRVRYDLRDTPTWSAWQSTAGYYRMVDSAQVRHTSSSEEETETEQTFYAGNDAEIFSVTTEAEAEPEPPAPPTLFTAYGGESSSQVPITWTDPLTADSIRIYRDTKNDTTDMVWIASVAFGVESYLNTGLTANTEYWYTAKSLRDGLLSPYVVPDSATTLEASGDTLGANLLVNGDFETAFSGGNNVWEGSFGATGEQSTEQVYAGTYSGKCITNGGGTGFRPQNGYIDYEAGKRYWIEGYIYIVGGTDTYVSCYLTGYPDQAIYLNTTRDEWVYFSHPVDVVTLIEDGRVVFEHYGGTPNVTFYLDNVSVKERLE